jgi:hypothetical protein
MVPLQVVFRFNAHFLNFSKKTQLKWSAIGKNTLAQSDKPLSQPIRDSLSHYKIITFIFLLQNTLPVHENYHEGIFAFTQWAFRCYQSHQICTACAEIFLCLNSADQLKVEPTGQVAFTCPVHVGSIRQDTRSR